MLTTVSKIIERKNYINIDKIYNYLCFSIFYIAENRSSILSATIGLSLIGFASGIIFYLNKKHKTNKNKKRLEIKF